MHRVKDFNAELSPTKENTVLIWVSVCTHTDSCLGFFGQIYSDIVRLLKFHMVSGFIALVEHS